MNTYCSRHPKGEWPSCIDCKRTFMQWLLEFLGWRTSQ